jgi:predicted MFS family arabinose efflux permease
MDRIAESGSAAGRIGRLALLFLAHAAGTTNITLVLAMAPAVEQALGISHAAFGLIVSAYYGALLLAALPAGILVDRLGIRMSLAAANVLLALGMMVFAASSAPATAAIGLALCGLGYTLVNPATARGVLAWFPPRGRATAMGVKQTGVPAGGVIAAIAAATPFGWRELAIACAISGLVTALACAALRVAEPVVTTPTRLGEIRALLRMPSVTAFNIAACLYATAQGGVFAYFVLFAREDLLVAAPLASLCLGVAYVASATGRIGWGIVSDMIARNGRIVGLVLCGVIGAAGTVGLLLVPSAGGVALPLAAFLVGLTLGGYAALPQTAAAEAVEPRLAGAAIGYNMLLTSLGTTLGPSVFGAVIELAGFTTAWWLAAAIIGSGALLFHTSARLGAQAKGRA